MRPSVTTRVTDKKGSDTATKAITVTMGAGDLSGDGKADRLTA